MRILCNIKNIKKEYKNWTPTDLLHMGITMKGIQQIFNILKSELDHNSETFYEINNTESYQIMKEAWTKLIYTLINRTTIMQPMVSIKINEKQELYYAKGTYVKWHGRKKNGYT